MLKLWGLEMLQYNPAFLFFTQGTVLAQLPQMQLPQRHQNHSTSTLSHKGDMIQTRLYLRLGDHDQQEHRH